MPDTIEKTENFSKLSDKISDLLSNESSCCSREVLVVLEEMVKYFSASNKIIDAHTKILINQDKAIKEHQRYIDRTNSATIVTLYFLGIIQLIVLAASGYVFNNMQHILSTDAVLVEKLNLVSDEVIAHRKSMVHIEQILKNENKF